MEGGTQVQEAHTCDRCKEAYAFDLLEQVALRGYSQLCPGCLVIVRTIAEGVIE